MVNLFLVPITLGIIREQPLEIVASSDNILPLIVVVVWSVPLSLAQSFINFWRGIVCCLFQSSPEGEANLRDPGDVVLNRSSVRR